MSDPIEARRSSPSPRNLEPEATFPIQENSQDDTSGRRIVSDMFISPSLRSNPDLSPGCDTSRAISATAGVDVRLLDYVSPFDRNLMCPICHCPFIDGVRLECDHIFCQRCIDQALESQAKPVRDCPSCRRVVNFQAAQRAPRVITQMVDELKVRCPQQEEGCPQVLARAHVQDHIDKYCSYTEVECLASDCRLPVLRKEVGRGCLHSVTSCPDCSCNVMEVDLKKHQTRFCDRSRVPCPDCGTAISRPKMHLHSKIECPEAITVCFAAPYGCSYQSRRIEVEIHQKSCPLAALAPFLKEQDNRLYLQEALNEQLRRKNEILEGGLSAIQTALNKTTDEVDTTYFSTPPPSGGISASSENTRDAPPTDSPALDAATHYLLLLHESLREEVSRVSSAVSDLDAKTSMMFVNENLRMKGEMGHTNAAINGLRRQMQWLVSSRLQAQSETAGRPSISGPENALRSALAGGAATSAPRLPILEPIRRTSNSNVSSTMIGDIPRL